jgi:hypothetical protein
MHKEGSQQRKYKDDWNLPNEEVNTFLLSLCFLSDNIKQSREKKKCKQLCLIFENLASLI